MTSPIIGCPIWGEDFPAKVQRRPLERIIEVSDSPRAGGGYFLQDGAEDEVRELKVVQKAILTTWLIDQRQMGTDYPKVTKGVLEYIKARRPLPVHERADRLLRFIAEQSKSIGERVSVQRKSPVALAWSESISWDEVYHLSRYLEEKNWVKIPRIGPYLSAQVTVEGFSRIANQATNVGLAQAFVAMWFDSSMEKAYYQGIEPAVREAGYKALRIDQKQHNNKIDDEIIAEIRRSKFLVVDSTHGRGGARGGVYYEAGFAHGFGLKVIFTCRKNAIKRVHFDTNHYNHVLWATPEDLHKKVKDRILAEFGQGPVPLNQ